MSMMDIQKKHQLMIKQLDKKLTTLEKKRGAYANQLSKVNTDIDAIQEEKRQLISTYEKIKKKQEKLNNELNKDIENYLQLVSMKNDVPKKEKQGGNIATVKENSISETEKDERNEDSIPDEVGSIYEEELFPL